MTAPFSESFKQQAVEKALRRNPGVTLDTLAEEWGVSRSTVQRWIRESRTQVQAINSSNEMTKEKRPQDWTMEEKLEMVITCSNLNEENISKRCREKGVYPHHVEQWKIDFIEGAEAQNSTADRAETKKLSHENKELKKALRRKEKALAETAALLVLQKKVNAIWGNDEDSSL